jgi:hypothetical protein
LQGKALQCRAVARLAKPSHLKVQILPRNFLNMKRFLPTLILIPLLAGCMVEGRDAATGERIWGPLSQADAATRPTVNPDTGSTVIVKTTGDVDEARVKEIVDAASPYIPSPYREILVAGVTLAGVFAAQRRRPKSVVVKQ